MEGPPYKSKSISDAIIICILVLSALGVGIPFIIGMSSYSILGLYIAIPAIIAAALYMKQRNANEENIDYRGRNDFYYCACLYLVLFSTSIITIYFSEVRPIIYYVLIASISGIILYEILFFQLSNNRALFILLQILLLHLNILWGVTLNYHFYISRTDPLAHVWFISELIDMGRVTEAIFGDYEAFPLWHILVSITYQLSGFYAPIHKVMFFVNGMVYAFIIVVTYLIGKKLFENRRDSLIITLFVCVFPPVISYGMGSIARSVIPIFLLLIIYLLIREKNYSNGYLLILLTIATVIYHHASAPFILLIFGLIYLLQYVNNSSIDTNIIDVKYLVTAFIFTLSYWIYASDFIFNEIIKHLVRPGYEKSFAQGVTTIPLSEVINYLQYSPIIFFTVVGILYILDREKVSQQLQWFCLLGAFFLLISIPGPLLLIEKFTFNFNIGRMGTYTFFFICSVAAFGLIKVFSKLKGNYKYLVVIAFATMCFLCVSNDFNASDNPITKRPFYTFYLTEEETTAFRSVAEFDSPGYIFADYVATRYYSFSEFRSKSHILEMGASNNRILTSSKDDLVLIRIGEWHKRPLQFYSSQDSEFRSNPSWNRLMYFYLESYSDNLKALNTVYNSGNVVAHTPHFTK